MLLTIVYTHTLNQIHIFIYVYLTFHSMFYIRILYTIHNGEKDVDDNTDDKDDDYDGQSNGGSFCL